MNAPGTMNFRANFWPNVVATMIGIILGVPVALALNNYFTEQAALTRSAEERTQIEQMLASVSAALDPNKSVLETIESDLSGPDGRVLEPPLDTAAGAASRPQSHRSSDDLIFNAGSRSTSIG